MSDTPRTDASLAGETDTERIRALYKVSRELERENAKLKTHVLLAETAVTACHSAMLGKVNPKDHAWTLVYAVQDAKR